MRKIIMAATAALAVTACSTYGDGYGYNDGYGPSGYSNYDWDRPDPSYNGYYAERYYRDDPRYQERRLSRQDRLYRGQDGRYYCRRSDGTTGLIVGGVAGGILGNIIAPGGSGLLGTIIGGAAGAAVGREVERGEVRCR